MELNEHQKKNPKKCYLCLTKIDMNRSLTYFESVSFK